MLKEITVTHFRNISESKTYSCGFCTLIHGPNASGKTNLLEAIYVLNYAHGFRSSDVRDLFSYDADDFSVTGEFHNEGNEQKYKVYIKNGISLEKAYFINGAKRTLREFQSRSTPIVLFQPSDLLLVTGTPSIRRSYIDVLLIHTDPEYKQAKINYDHGLYKRNKLLLHMRNGNFAEVIDFWDTFLQTNASILHKKRAAIVEYFNAHAKFEGMYFNIGYEQNVYTKKRSLELRDTDVRVGRTSFGPQLDEFILLKKYGSIFRKLSSYGSRSEQRLGVLWLKRTELLYLVDVLGVSPLLMLDDVFSELDEENSKRIVTIAHEYQTFMTTAHLDMLKHITYPLTKIELGK
ncbi:MAG: DNA replication and repair protein RecF [Candidatus Roizmanbacteria bacterium]|nr:DNA replication and repair protein RecF [Candidatus Roizmanbacteria bacterium]